jgi:glycyl-tRNA synthetase beta subunit
MCPSFHKILSCQVRIAFREECFQSFVGQRLALILNTEGIAEEICKTIFAIHPDDLADMIKQGMTAKQIAFGLNMSVAGLYRRAQRLFRRPWSELCSGLS